MVNNPTGLSWKQETHPAFLHAISNKYVLPATYHCRACRWRIFYKHFFKPLQTFDKFHRSSCNNACTMNCFWFKFQTEPGSKISKITFTYIVCEPLGCLHEIEQR